MAKIQNQEVKTSKEIGRNSDYNKELMDFIINSIISKTTKASSKFRIEVNVFSDSSRLPEKLQIVRARYLAANSKITFGVQGAHSNHVWLVELFLTKEVQGTKRATDFVKEIKNAAKTVCIEIAKNADAQKNNDEPPPQKTTPERNVGGTEKKDEPPTRPVQNSTSATIRGRRRRKVMISSIITDELIVNVLRAWRVKYTKLREITQRELKNILEEIDPNLNANRKTQAVNFLDKQGIILKVKDDAGLFVRPKRKAFALLEKDDKKREEAKQKAQEREFIKKSLDFPVEALPSLEGLNSLLEHYLEMKAREARKLEIEKEIITLRKELKELEERDESLPEGFEESLSAFNPKKLAKLIETAKEAKTTKK